MTRTAWLVAVALVLAVAGRAAALETLRPGMKAPEFSLEHGDGGTLAARDVQDARVVVLAFWATWSDTAPEALARLEALHARYRARGLVVLGVNVERARPAPDDLARARALARRLGLTFPLLADPGLAAFGAYGVVAVPSLIAMRGDLTVLGDLAAWPLAGREEFFDLVEAAVLGTPPKSAAVPGRQPNARAVRYWGLGRALAERGHVEAAEQNLLKAVELDAAFAPPLTRLGQLYRERAARGDGVRFAGQAVATVRVSPEERARLLEDAERVLHDALRLEPSSAPALTELAAVRLARQDPAGARALLDRALSSHPSYAPARARLGAVLLRVGDVERGRREIEDAVRLNPLDWRLAVIAAEAYDERGLAADAGRHYRRGTELLWQAHREPWSLMPAGQ